MLGIGLGTRFLRSARRTIHPSTLSFFVGYSSKAQSMVVKSHDGVTRVLFCGGKYFPAAQNYTREYLKSNPCIQVDDVAYEEIPNVIHKYHICVVKMFRMDAATIAKANQMKLIMQFGVGLEGVDIDAATHRNIKVARIPSQETGNAASCAEMAIYLTLGLLRKQKEMEIAIKSKDLGLPAGETLFGKTVFIMGYGAIGAELAKRLRPFDVKVIATKRNWSSNPNRLDDDELIDKKGFHENIYEFAKEADIVIPCLNLNVETAGIINEKFLSHMRKGSYLINISRGGILDYDSVLHNLESGHLGGLAIDVAWTEPFDPNDRILKFPNVLITPHVAGVSEYSYRTMAKVVGDCALQFHAGQPLTGIEIVN